MNVCLVMGCRASMRSDLEVLPEAWDLLTEDRPATLLSSIDSRWTGIWRFLKHSYYFLSLITAPATPFP